MLGDGRSGVDCIGASKLHQRFRKVALRSDFLAGFHVLCPGVKPRSADFQLIQRIGRIFRQRILIQFEGFVEFPTGFRRTALRDKLVPLTRSGGERSG